MEIPKIPESEYRFCQILWAHEPVSAVELVKLCQQLLQWKRTTTYTVIKRLSQRGVVSMEDGMVRSLVSRADAESAQAGAFVETRFGGSIPAFLAAFSRQQTLSPAELDEVQQMIDRIRGGG